MPNTMLRAMVPPLPFVPTIPNLLAHAVSTFPDDEFLVCGDQRLTFREADDQSAQLALGLMALGVGKGTRVGILMPNSADWVLCWLAAARLGSLTVPISTFYQARELMAVLRHSDVHVLLTIDHYLGNDYVSRLDAIPGLSQQEGNDVVLVDLPYLRHVLVWGDQRRHWAKPGPDELIDLQRADARLDRALLGAVEVQVVPADDLMIIFTSGSTATPKAVVHTHESAIRLSCAFRDSGWLDLRPGDRVYSAVPLFWVGGHNSSLLPALYVGACMVMSLSPDPDAVLDLCSRESVTGINAWTPQLKALTERATSRGVVLPQLRSRLTQVDGDGPIPPDLIPNLLGMTETFGPHGLEPRGSRLPREKPGAFGRSLPGIERRIVDPATGRECLPGEPGELYVRGYSLMRGLYKESRRETFDPDGFYPTGDRCRIDEDGFLYFEGRLGEMIKTSGANVSPREVEVVLESWPEVREAVVLGIPDPKRDQAVVAVVVLSGTQLDQKGLAEFLRGELSHFKIPHFLISMSYEDIPRAAAGKVKKDLLRDIVLSRRDQLIAGSH